MENEMVTASADRLGSMLAAVNSLVLLLLWL